MVDIIEYRTIISYSDCRFFIKGSVDDDRKTNPDPAYWLRIKVIPNFHFSGESELFVQKHDIQQLIDELTQMHKDTRGQCNITCKGWGSYLNFKVGKLGELTISGKLNKRWEENDNHLKFKMTSDQTIIPPLIIALKQLIK